MGITGELVRSVFSKSRSVQRHDSQGHHGRSNAAEKKKWSSSVRSYLCGDEHNSALAADDLGSVRSSTVAEVDLASFRSNRATNISTGGGGDVASVYADEDTASVRGSEATVNQLLHEDSNDENREEKQNSTYRLFRQDAAALIIQAAFRSFQARRARREAKTQDDEQEPAASPSRESIGTSIEVQTGKYISQSRRKATSKNTRARAQVLKIQEDWDDSTVSSVISKMRMQNRLEAATRRERALAYAFSQQLRICSKKKQSTTSCDETNMGWSWLERWMAARQPELTLMAESITGSEQKTIIRKRMLDAAAMEEKESCGSNDVSSLVEVGVLSVPKNVPRPAKTRSKETRSLSRQNSACSHLCPRESKDPKKACHLTDEKEKRKRTKPPVGNKRDIKNATTQQGRSAGDQEDLAAEPQRNGVALQAADLGSAKTCRDVVVRRQTVATKGAWRRFMPRRVRGGGGYRQSLAAAKPHFPHALVGPPPSPPRRHRHPHHHPRQPSFISSCLSDTTVSIIDIPFPQDVQSIPPGVESTDKLPDISLWPDLLAATKLMESHFEQILESLPLISFMITDVFLGWTLDSANKYNIARLACYPMSTFPLCLARLVSADPERVKGTKAYEITTEQIRASSKSHGIVANTFYELDSVFNDFWNSKIGPRAWCLRPLSLAEPKKIKLVNYQTPWWISRLDQMLEEGRPVLYVAFGTQVEISPAQFREIQIGLEKSGVNFLWLVRKNVSELEEGFEERVRSRGMVVKE
ncbi:UDP-glycosyltransferase 90A1 [Sesamum alatum]|uniref:UDP-glycosyltransferase 90A1 n=1 Tax=Sesamum alatum TaxID=300844 RepID=A0AAE2CGT1_9LAMI|nr:UDP-glycosyltransferase 90A1 [Sesamum alatum]